MLSKKISFILLIWSFWNASSIFAQTRALELKDGEKSWDIGKKEMQVFEDKSRFMTLKKVLAAEEQFKNVSVDVPNYGYSQSAFWAKFQLKNPLNTPQEAWVEVDYPSLDSVSFFVVNAEGETIKKVEAGFLYKFEQRDIKTKNFVFSVHLAPQETLKILLRISSDRNNTFPIKIWKPDTYLNHINNHYIGFGLYYGIMFVMLFYNLFLYTVLRERSYLYYILFIISVVFFLGSFNGYGFQYLWSGLPAFNRFNISLFISMLAFSGVNFGREFLNTKVRMPKANRVLEIIMLICLVAIVLALVLPNRISIKLSVFMGLPSVITLLYVSFVSLQQGYKPARYFSLAWSVFLLGAFLTAMRSFGWLPHNFVTLYSIQIGSALEVVLLSLALADKISILRKEIADKEVEKERLEKDKEKERREYSEEQNKQLEVLVQERTKILEERNVQVTDSLIYAQRIQQAILPSKNDMIKVFPDIFVYFKPRDLVSGDFYWFAEKDNKAIIAAVDCTGHGVPGAFMSMIGNTLLNQIVLERGITRPAEILNQLEDEIRFALKQDTLEDGNKDGMDVSICVYHQVHNILEFAGANNSLWIVRNGVIDEIKGDRMGIGGDKKENYLPYNNHILKLAKEEAIVYLATDGFADQFGGDKNKKFMASNLKKLLLEISPLSLKAQHLKLNKTMEDWKGENKQLDDQLIIGFKIKADAHRQKIEVSYKEFATRKTEQPHKFTR